MTMIPDFDVDGLLPPGDYEVSFEELRASSLVLGRATALTTRTGTLNGVRYWSPIWKS